MSNPTHPNQVDPSSNNVYEGQQQLQRPSLASTHPNPSVPSRPALAFPQPQPISRPALAAPPLPLMPQTIPTPMPVRQPTNVTRTIHQQVQSVHQSQRPNQARMVIDRFANGASPNLVAAVAMIIQQMEEQTSHPALRLSITTSYGPLNLTATLSQGEWCGNDLTQPISDPRISQTLGLPNAPLHQNESVYLYSGASTEQLTEHALMQQALTRQTTDMNFQPINPALALPQPSEPLLPRTFQLPQQQQQQMQLPQQQQQQQRQPLMAPLPVRVNTQPVTQLHLPDQPPNKNSKDRVPAR